MLEARWQGLRARCALQWCLDGQTRLVGYQDGRRTGAADTAIQVLLSTARAGLAMHARRGLREVTQARLLRGLTAIVALDAMRANQVGELGLEQLSPEGSALHGEALHAEAVAALTPLLVRALDAHPEAAQLRAWVVDSGDLRWTPAGKCGSASTGRRLLQAPTMSARVPASLIASSMDGFIAGPSDDLSSLRRPTAAPLRLRRLHRRRRRAPHGARHLRRRRRRTSNWYYGKTPVLVATHRPLTPRCHGARGGGQHRGADRRGLQTANGKDVYLDERS